MLGKEVFAYFDEAGFKPKFAKCKFLKAKITVGHTVDSDGMHTHKISSIEDFPQPQSVENVRSCLGLCWALQNLHLL